MAHANSRLQSQDGATHLYVYSVVCSVQPIVSVNLYLSVTSHNCGERLTGIHINFIMSRLSNVIGAALYRI